MNSGGVLSIRSVLENGIEREKMSIRTYDRALKTVKDEPGRELLKRLRHEEAVHARLLKEAMESDRIELIGGKPLSEAPPDAPAEKASLADDARPENILAFAIRQEESAIEYYSRYVDTFRGTELGELFRRLLREEEAHREKLIRMVEKRRWQGGKPA